MADGRPSGVSQCCPLDLKFHAGELRRTAKRMSLGTAAHSTRLLNPCETKAPPSRTGRRQETGDRMRLGHSWHSVER